MEKEYLVEETPIWIPQDQYPFHGTIVETSLVKGKYSTDVRLMLEQKNSGRRYAFDAWGSNKNFLITHYTNDIREWVKKDVYIKMLEDGKREVNVPAA